MKLILKTNNINKKKIAQKVISFFLVLCLVVSIVPTMTTQTEAKIPLPLGTILRSIKGVAIRAAAMSASAVANKAHHVFRKPQHNLGPFLRAYGGNQVAAFRDVRTVATRVVANRGIINGVHNIPVTVRGHNLTVRVKVIGGRVHISTFWRR